MTDINIILLNLANVLSTTTSHRLAIICEAILSMTDRITMLGISRWTEKGGSYRTVQRFFSENISWCRVHWYMVFGLLKDKNDVILLAGDETVVTKSGKKTFGLDRYFSSIYGRTIPSISFLSLSLISVKQRKSYPMMMEQIVRDMPEERAKPKKKRSKAGRPKGSKNKNKLEAELSPYLLWMQALIRNLLMLISNHLNVCYFVYDNALGNSKGVTLAESVGLHLISKLKNNSALWFPFEGVYSGRGAPRKYGEKVSYDDLPDKYLKNSEVRKNILTDIYPSPSIR